MTADEVEVIWISITVATASVLISLPAGIAFGYVLARFQFPGKTLLDAFLSLALVLPPVVTGYVLLVLLGRRGWIGGWLEDWFGISVAFTWFAAVIAAAVVSFPLLVRAIRLGFENVDPRLEVAARSLGAGPWRAFWTVSLPLAFRGVLAGAILAFARSLGEFGATILFAGNTEQTRTISVAIYSLTQRPGGFEASGRLVLASVVLAVIALVVSETLARRAVRHGAT